MRLRDEDFVSQVDSLTNGRGVDIVYDSIGADTFAGSIACLAYQGALINFGQSSGAVPPFAVSMLSARSSSVTRPVLFHYMRDRLALVALAKETFDAYENQVIKTDIGVLLPLEQAGEAHRALESRSTTGSVVLLP
jgi:NADPH2:quinone reductase